MKLTGRGKRKKKETTRNGGFLTLQSRDDFFSKVEDILNSIYRKELADIIDELYKGTWDDPDWGTYGTVPIIPRRTPIPGNTFGKTPVKWVPVSKPPCFRETITPYKAGALKWTIKVSPEVQRELWTYWYTSPGEISGLGLISCEKDPNIDSPWEATITEITPLSQKEGHDTAASSDLGTQALADYYVKLCREGKDPEQAKLFWHSHVEMGCFWSGTDVRDWIEDTLDEQRLSSKVTSGWLCSLVVSGKGTNIEFGCRVDGWLYEDETHTKILEWIVDVPITVDASLTNKSCERHALEKLGRPENNKFWDYEADPYASTYVQGTREQDFDDYQYLNGWVGSGMSLIEWDKTHENRRKLSWE